MPKGEHFKKDNPRNHQVSFKVNTIELEKLRALASASNLSVPEWLRSHIDYDNGNPVAPKPKPTKKEVQKAKTIVESSIPKGEQTSLF